MRLPTEDEINVHNSLDERTACEHFLNKTLLEAEALFRENSSYYQEDLMWMGQKAFNFYLQSVINYLNSVDSAGDDHLINCLYEILLFRSNDKEFMCGIDGVNMLIDYIISNYNKFNIDDNIYG